jgi:hypothetical protein
VTSTYIDDLYILTTSGSANTTFWGDVHIEARFPTSDATYSQWTPSTGTDHYALVDETTPNTTDYVSSLTPGQKDTYGFQDLTATDGTVMAVQEMIYAQKSDAGARSIAGLSRVSSTDYDGETKALTSSYTYYTHVMERNPNTGIAWTISEVNASEFGVDEIA